MGAWRFVREQFLDGCVPEAGARLPRYVGRKPSAAPAPGSLKLHQLEPQLAGFAGRMKLTDDEVVWFLERQD